MTAPDPAILHRLGEHFAAGYFEEPAASPMRRWSRAVRRRFEHRAPMPYDGSLLYPCGPCHPPDENRMLAPSYSFTWGYNDAAVDERLKSASAEECETLLALQETMRAERDLLWVLRTPHTVGGAGYTHSIPNYGRVLREGLNEHARRIARGLENTSDEAEAGFYLGLQDVLAGIAAWHANLIRHLEGCPYSRNRARLVRALKQVPFEPARDFFEAVVAYNFVYYLDDCDNPGRLDLELWPYYDAEKGTGAFWAKPPSGLSGKTYLSPFPREALAFLTTFSENVFRNWGWSEAIGGTLPDGGPAYNDLTVLCIQAARGKARPSLQLRIRRDMPDEVWDAAFDLLATGNGLPALYNEEGYLAALREAGLGIAEEDLSLWNGGGCTETMIHGRSNVGSLDAGVNLPLAFVESLGRHLATASSFESLVAAVKEDFAAVITETCRLVSLDQETKARWRPQPMRSLLIDDCIERGVEFNAGGARYNWSVVNVAGLANVADSLAAIREVVFEKREKTGAELLDILHRDFEGEEKLRQRLGRCPRFGNNDPRADDIAAEIAELVFRQSLDHKPWRGGRFLPSTIMFVTYADAGARVGATPDGRRAGEPIADSIGPVQGRDRNGAAAMLSSVAKLPLHLAPGTPILNARFAKGLFADPKGRRCLRDLITTYFDLGGMQIQINVVDQDVLRDALAHPDHHGDLIVRVGGYSAHFVSLPRAVQESILERTEHEACSRRLQD
jgi:formate C-acetyltransferase